MKEFKEFINELNTDKPVEAIITFFIDNEWFGEAISKENGKIMLSESQIELFSKKLETFLNNDLNSLYAQFAAKFTQTDRLFNNFLSEIKIDEETRYHLTDFMLFRLTKDLFLYKDSEIEEYITEKKEDN